MKGPQRLVQRFGDELWTIFSHVDRRSFLRYCASIARHAPAILRTRKLAPADEAMAPREIQVRFGRAALRLPGEHFGLVREILCRQVYQRLPGFEPGPGQLVLDLGANVGVFSVSAAAAGARVVAVEAQVGFVRELERIASWNRVADRVKAIHALVGETTGVFASSEERRRASHMFDEEPPVLTVEEVMEMASIDRVSLMKIDVEGSEFALFDGETSWLERVDRVVLEVHADYGRPPAIIAALQDGGFATQVFDSAGQASEASDERDCFVFAQRRRPGSTPGDQPRRTAPAASR
ncbi:MAG: FkbM family methyltransferase [Deltaproteobacteria bacterium]|nr:FkbM family methyltransferase [Deltaproteobacteria bacterium]MBW2531050.1 FkbM family methyltransferase [Deltaproteobacteria bacterium]